jgi:hypothetical protein
MNIAGIEMQTGKGVLAKVQYMTPSEVEQYIKQTIDAADDFIHRLETAYDFVNLTNTSLSNKKPMFDACGDLVNKLHGTLQQIDHWSDCFFDLQQDYESEVEQ